MSRSEHSAPVICFYHHRIPRFGVLMSTRTRISRPVSWQRCRITTPHLTLEIFWGERYGICLVRAVQRSIRCCSRHLQIYQSHGRTFFPAVKQSLQHEKSNWCARGAAWLQKNRKKMPSQQQRRKKIPSTGTFTVGTLALCTVECVTFTCASWRILHCENLLRTPPGIDSTSFSQAARMFPTRGVHIAAKTSSEFKPRAGQPIRSRCQNGQNIAKTSSECCTIAGLLPTAV